MKTCQCKKTKCLKLYCECFQSNNLCQIGCECRDCHNQENYSTFIFDAYENVIRRNPNAFQDKSQPVLGTDFSLKSCYCKKSYCLKKYCECFQHGLFCNPKTCSCSSCKNYLFSVPLLKQKNGHDKIPIKIIGSLFMSRKSIKD